MTGLRHSSAAMAAGVAFGLARSGRGVAGASPVIISLTSSPEQKAGSAPVTTTQRTASSAPACRNAASISA